MPFLWTASDRTKYSLYRGKLCIGTVKSIRYSGDFVIAGFVVAGFVSTYFTVFLPGSYMLFVITGYSL